MPGIRVAVDATTPVRLRAVSSLLADGRIERIGVMGTKPPVSWGDRAVAIGSADGWDVVVGIEPAPGQPSVSVGEEGTVSGAGPSGLTRALARRFGLTTMAATSVGRPVHGGPRFGFPQPLGWLHGEPADDIHQCPITSRLAGILATDQNSRSVAIVDVRDFLDGCALAAGVLLFAGGATGPVWASADRYLEEVAVVGLVLADTAD